MAAHEVVEVGRPFLHLFVEAELGRGAFGTVYRARDPEIGRRVALKVVRIPAGEADTHADRRRMREARALGALVHPNVATLYRVHAPDRATLVLELEFVDGVSYDALLAGGARLDADGLRTLLRGVAAGLHAAHGAHVVHGDVKPANVLRGHDGAVKLVDFGLARMLESGSVRSSAGRLAGTPQYLAPEVVEGAPPSPASDAWSLGVLGYRAACGRLPFDAASMPGLFFRILNTEPPPLPDGTPKAVRDLVLACLAKRPEDRPSLDGAQVAALDGGRSGPDTAPAADSVGGSAAALVGRALELAALRDRLGRVASGGRAGVVLTGAPGVGKSRLAATLATEARARGFALVRCTATAAEGVLRPVHRALVAASRASSASSRGASSPRADPLDEVPAVAVERHLRALGEERAVVVVVDDLHRAEADDVVGLARVAARLDGVRVLFVVTERVPDPDAPPGRAPRHAALPADAWDLVEVGPLPRDAVARLLLEGAEGGAPPDLVERAVSRAGGNPLFALHLLAHAVEARDAARRAGEPDPTSTASSDPPPVLRDFMARRLRGLPEDLREVLDAAAVIGPTFDAEEVASVLGTGALDVLRRLQRLAHRPGLVEPLDHGYRFAHPLLQETVYAGVAPDLRRTLHRALATALEARATPVDPERLGSHWERADEAARATPHLLRAAQQASRRVESWRCVDLAARAGVLASPIPAELARRHASELFDVANSLGETGRPAERARVHDALERAAAEAGDEALALRVRAWRALGSVVASPPTPAEEAGLRAVAERLDLGVEAGVARYVLGIAAQRRGDLDGADAWLARADEAFLAVGAKGRHGSALNQRAVVAASRGDRVRAAALYAEAAAVCREAGRLTNAEISEVNGLLVEVTLGRVDGVVERFDRAARTIDAGGSRAAGARVAVVAAEVVYALGDLAGARARAGRALDTLSRLGASVGVVEAAVSAAELAVAAGDVPAAAGHLAAARAAVAAGGTAPTVPVRLDAIEALVAWVAGRPEDARAAAARVIAAARAAGGLGDEAEPVLDAAVLGLPLDDGGPPPGVLAGASPVARALAAALEARRVGDPVGLETAAAELRAPGVGLRRAFAAAVADGFRAIAARLRGREDDADREAESAADRARRLGHVPLASWAGSLGA